MRVPQVTMVDRISEQLHGTGGMKLTKQMNKRRAMQRMQEIVTVADTEIGTGRAGASEDARG